MSFCASILPGNWTPNYRNGLHLLHKWLSENDGVLSVSDSLQPHGPYPTKLLCPWDFPSKNTGVGCHVLLQGIFPIQGSNPHLLHHRWILYLLSHWGSSRIMVTGTNYGISCFYNLVPRPIYFVYLKQKHGWLLVMHDILRLRKAEGSFFSSPVYYWSGFRIECHSCYFWGVLPSPTRHTEGARVCKDLVG